ncbi:MAG TPA: protein kinase [Pyrinomonadaceae bacterium]|nr:protein kinase [Pyrinomonadaceae bacterium]
MITHERWQRIKEIFQSAQERPPAERFEFLNQACGDDPSIREQVEALLTADESNADFLSAPAYEFAAGMLSGAAKEPAEFSTGQKVGRYTILCPLGEGGMGQIYLANDEQLGRKIALKMIARQFATDPRRVLRFEQEARAASALNHPNVCVIHDVGVTENNRHFIAMEYIQGITLRDKLSREPVTPIEALQIAGQVAAALAAAHAAGIVHRDIKPENIMLRPDGYVKVLDFGLAKLTEVVAEEPLDVNAVSTKVRTEAGTLMGTVKYMSPEQLREFDLDERTDIWSLGVVMYEMLTRTMPFEAKTPNGTIALIVGPQSPALALPDDLPPRYRELVRKMIEKDRAVRYQSMTKLAADLNTLQKELERASDNGVLTAPAWYPPPVGQQTRTIDSDSGILPRIKSQALSTAEFIFTEIRTHKAAALFTGATGVLVLLLLIPNMPRWYNRIFDKASNAQEIVPKEPVPAPVMKTLTNNNNTICAAISPDRKKVAHVEEQNGKQRLVLMITATFGSSEVVPAADVQYLGVTFSRDNEYLYFTRKEKSHSGVLYRLALPGGPAVKVSERVDSPITFSPDGDRFAFVRHDSQHREFLLMLANVDGTNERVLATRKGPHEFSTYGLSWSPDGSTIVCPVSRWDGGHRLKLIAFNVNTGEDRAIGEQSWSSVYGVDWESDKTGLIFSARDGDAITHQLWRMSYPEGVAQKLTTEVNDYRHVSVAGDKTVTVETRWTWRTWIATLDGSTDPKLINSGGQGLTYGLTWSRTGRIIFSAIAQDRLNIEQINPDGSNQVLLTRDAGNNYSPVTSSDGRYVVFVSTRNKTFDLYRMDAEDGSNVTRLTSDDRNYYPSLSPDDQWIIYERNVDGTRSIWKLPFSGGQPVKLADRYRMPVYSPDQRMFAARFETKSGTHGVAIFSADDGRLLDQFPVDEIEWQRIYWLDDHTLSFIKNVDGTSNIWSYDLRTKASKQLTNFTGDLIFAYAWSPDFKQVVCQRGAKLTNATMISSER